MDRGRDGHTYGGRERDQERDGVVRDRYRERRRNENRDGSSSKRRHTDRQRQRREHQDSPRDGPSGPRTDQELKSPESRRAGRRPQSLTGDGREPRAAEGDAPDGDKMDVPDVQVRRGGPLPSQADSFALVAGGEAGNSKEKPNFGNTGVLAAASNSVNQADGSTIILKYHEPPEARKPSAKDRWKLFVFKGPEIIDTVDLSDRSCWLVGRELAVVDLPAEHPSISKQHAVVQFRYIERRNEFGDKVGKVKPYLIDLESANGTVLNKDKVPESRYLELMDKDVIQFGHSTREYVLMLAR